VEVFENNTKVDVEIIRSGALDKTISVNLATMDETALG